MAKRRYEVTEIVTTIATACEHCGVMLWRDSREGAELLDRARNFPWRCPKCGEMNRAEKDKDLGAEE